MESNDGGLTALVGWVVRKISKPGGPRSGKGLDRLKLELDHLFENRAASLLKDPWQARDAYIQVILERSQENLESFFT